jgi:hypothetical protein
MYQSHLPIRVTQDMINQTVERKGIACTHVDALRFFAPAAAPLNHHGAVLQRTDQLRLDQKACVHAHMDLLKMTLKLLPFIDDTLVQDVLHVALQARTLDVAASPYDASSYGVPVVPVETSDGRRFYRQQQVQLAEMATPIRTRLLSAYDTFLQLAFDPYILEETKIPVVEEMDSTGTTTTVPSSGKDNNKHIIHNARYADHKDRYAQAEPGSRPWRANPVVQDQQQQ